MIGIFKRLFGKVAPPVSAETMAALEKSGAVQAFDKAKAGALSDAMRREQGLACSKGHPIYKGQRPEDCFDCHLLTLMSSEKPAGAAKTETTVVGAMLCLNGFHRGEAFPLVMSEDVPIVIGADPDCEMVLSDERISRRHISMVRRQGRTTVRDLNSLHHSAMRAEGELQWYVLDPEREYWFRDGCHIMLGDIEFLFRASDEQALKISAAAG